MSEFQSNTTSNINPLLARYGYLPGSPTMSPQVSANIYVQILDEVRMSLSAEKKS
jgi:hypothetical protein